jgi:hypothetical protein
MAYLRFTLLRPRPGAEEELQEVLEQLDASLADAPGLLFSFILSQARGRIGRVSLWLSKDEANREAASPHILSLRSRLRYLSLDTEETLLQVESGYVPAGFTALLDAAKQPAYFPAAITQPALPG